MPFCDEIPQYLVEDGLQVRLFHLECLPLPPPLERQPPLPIEVEPQLPVQHEPPLPVGDDLQPLHNQT